MGCGMRESGVTLSTPFPLVAMRSTAMKLDTVVAAEGQCVSIQTSSSRRSVLHLLEHMLMWHSLTVHHASRWLVGRQYMEFAIELATKKMQLNWERLAKLESGEQPQPPRLLIAHACITAIRFKTDH
eukprot:SAG11_NODE_637_length_8033_cov_4.585707_6_plen_127_part_00